MKASFQYLSTLACVSLLSACSSTAPISDDKKSTSFPSSAQPKANVLSSTQSTSGKAMQPDDLLYLVLMNEYRYWSGAPYQLGGNNLKGVDCSSLVQQVFHDSFNIPLPRTTELQVYKGYSIDKGDLQVADLVFFKTGWNTRHVGIYMGNNQFFHASTSKGVIISDLDNPYWKKHYWQSRRVMK